MRTILAFLLVALACLPAPRVAAHALEPGYLELRPLGASEWQVIWRVPDVQGRPMPIAPILPARCLPAEAPPVVPDGRAWSAAWKVDCTHGLTGGYLSIQGLERMATDVLVRFGTEPGGAVDQARRLTPSEPGFDVPQPQGWLALMGSYFALGVEHILSGWDHLLFVLGLMLLIHDRWRLLGAVTAFTVAHSFTLAAAALGWLHVPGPPVEAVIALSIVFLAREALTPSAPDVSPPLAQRAPWIVAFGFGLLHGLGFGSALLEIGLPQSEVPLALLAFNLGVEAGQILFVFAILGLVWTLLRLAQRASLPSVARTVPAYAVGCIAAYWTLERVIGMLA